MCTKTAHDAMLGLRHGLSLLRHPGADTATIKLFRASSSTAIVAAGGTLPELLDHGEWKSNAFLNYVSETEVDRQQFLQALLADEDDAVEP